MTLKRAETGQATQEETKGEEPVNEEEGISFIQMIFDSFVTRKQQEASSVNLDQESEFNSEDRLTAASRRKLELELQQKFQDELLARQEEDRQRNASILAKKAEEIAELQARNQQLQE